MSSQVTHFHVDATTKVVPSPSTTHNPSGYVDVLDANGNGVALFAPEDPGAAFDFYLALRDAAQDLMTAAEARYLYGRGPQL